MTKGPKKKLIKLCTGCNRMLPRSEFYQRSNGEIVSRCKQCSYRIANEWRIANPEKRKEQKRRYYLNGGKEVQKIAMKRNRENNPEIYKEINKKWCKNNKERIRLSNYAGVKVRKAIKNGTLIKSESCQKCGKKNCKIEASHSDYTKPLEVLWVCISCHRKMDSDYPKTKEGLCGV